MLQLPWYPEARAAAADASHTEQSAKAQPSKPGQADEQFRSALRGAMRNLVSEKGGLLKNAVVLPCGHVCDKYEADFTFKQKQAFLQRAEKANQSPERAKELRASAGQAYVCMRCPPGARRDIGKAPAELPAEVSINTFMAAVRRDIDGNVEDASAEALELLKKDLRKDGVGIPKMPKATPVATTEQAAYNCVVGESLARQNKFKEAESWFFAAVSAEPAHLRYNHNMAVCLKKQNRSADAAPYAEKVRASQPESARDPMQIGLELLSENKYAEAEPVFRKVLEREPLSANLHDLLGACYSGQSMHDEAFVHFNKALSMRPDHAKYRRDVGYSLYMLGRFSEAEGHLIEADKREPGNARFIYELGWCKRKLGKMDEAETLLRKAALTDTQNPHYANDLGMFYFLQKRYHEAEIHLRKAAKMAPESAKFSADVANCGRKIDKLATPKIERWKSKFVKVMEKLDEKMENANRRRR